MAHYSRVQVFGFLNAQIFQINPIIKRKSQKKLISSTSICSRQTTWWKPAAVGWAEGPWALMTPVKAVRSGALNKKLITSGLRGVNNLTGFSYKYM